MFTPTVKTVKLQYVNKLSFCACSQRPKVAMYREGITHILLPSYLKLSCENRAWIETNKTEAKEKELVLYLNLGYFFQMLLCFLFSILHSSVQKGQTQSHYMK